MFERFTEKARRVVVLAQEEARLLDHNYIGTEHILLGLVREEEGVAARTVASFGISVESVRRQVEEIIGRGEVEGAGNIPFTPRAKKVLELSLRESVELGHSYIGTEHILLGLLREVEGVGAQILVRSGATLEGVRASVIRMLEGDVPSEPAAVEHGVQASQGPPPRCPACGWSLLETMVFRSIPASEEGGGETRDIVVFSCGRCGTAIGGAPA